MKKLLILTMVAALMLTMFAACGGDEPTDPVDDNDVVTDPADDTAQNPDDTTEPDNTDEPEDTTEPDDATEPEENPDEGNVSIDDLEPLNPDDLEINIPEEINPDTIYAAIKETIVASGGEIGRLSDYDETYLKTFYNGLTMADFEAVGGQVATLNVSAEEYFIAKYDESNKEVIREAIDKHIEDLDATWSTYLPNVYEYVQNYDAFFQNGYVFVFISPYADIAHAVAQEIVGTLA